MKAQYEVGKIMIYLLLVIIAALIIAAVSFNLFQKGQKTTTEIPVFPLTLAIPFMQTIQRKKKGTVDPLVYLIVAIVLTVIFLVVGFTAIKFLGVIK
jgi:hypothetical protein